MRTCSRLLARVEPVHHGVLDDRLQQQHRHETVGDVGSTCQSYSQPVAEAHALEREISFGQHHFFLDGDLFASVIAQRRVQQLAELLDRCDGACGLHVGHQGRDAVERVVQEMRLKLRAQRGEARGLQPRLQLRCAKRAPLRARAPRSSPTRRTDTAAYVVTTVGIVLYHERVNRGITPKINADFRRPISDGPAVERGMRHRDREQQREMQRDDRGPQGRERDARRDLQERNGNVIASAIHRGIVDINTVSQSSGKPCVTDTCLASSAPMAAEGEAHARDDEARPGAVAAPRRAAARPCLAARVVSGSLARRTTPIRRAAGRPRTIFTSASS